MEIHSSDLTARCLKTVQLRWEGKIAPEATTALYRGALFDAACCLVHAGTAPAEAIPAAMLDVELTLVNEKRPLSKSVQANKNTIAVEVLGAVRLYAERIMPMFGATVCTQAPIRWKFSVDDEPVEFVSHIDLLAKDEHGLIVVDWKFRDEPATPAYLARNMQLACYWMACKHGEILTDADLGIWTAFKEYPRIAWIDACNLKPYGKKTTVGGVEFAKGEHRPVDRILRWVDMQEGMVHKFMEELEARVRMVRSGYFPTNPDPIGCHLCESRAWCPAWATSGANNADE